MPWKLPRLRGAEDGKPVLCPAQQPEAWGRSGQPRTNLCWGAASSSLLGSAKAGEQTGDRTSQGGGWGAGRYWWQWPGGWLGEQEEGPTWERVQPEEKGRRWVRGQLWGRAAQAVRRGSGAGSAESLQRTRGKSDFLVAQW